MTDHPAGTLIVLVGLPGSGKTEAAKHLVQKQGAKKFDDYYDGGGLLPHTALRYTELVSHLQGDGTAVVADIAFCKGQRLYSFLAAMYVVEPRLQLDLRFFSDNAEQCERNVRRRDQETDRDSLTDDLDAIKRFAPTYSVPLVHHLKVHGES